ncbi:MAG: type II toxin-antitoxin system RelE/ParE family toxin [Synergistaceae bacterium]|nr:type II toxin-antitoxin system RelE/ParE family toxin [Synergistaceae bacterium]
MKYRVEISRKFFGQLRKLDEDTRTQIIYWILDNIEGCEDPYGYGSHLIRTRVSYHVEGYRIISEIQGDRIIILTARRRRENFYKQEKKLRD